jgi:hypothetical protein
VKDDSGNDVERLVAYCRISLPTITLYLYCTAVTYRSGFLVTSAA